MVVGARVALVLAALVVTSTGCGVDNTGGEPPPGLTISWAEPLAELSTSCRVSAHGDRAALLDDADDIDAWLAPCGTGTDGDREALLDQVAALDEGERLVGVLVELGGAIRDWRFQGLYVDGADLYAWAVKEDDSYGGQPAPMPADGFSGERYVIAREGAEGATSADVHVGVMNPRLPEREVAFGER